MIRLAQDVYTGSTRKALLDNTLTVHVGDVIIPLAGTAAVVTNATAAVASVAVFPLGLVTGFIGPQDQVIGQGLASVGTTTPSSITTASNNTSAAYTGLVSGGQIYAQYIPITEDMEFLFDMQNAAGTTQAYSGLAFTWYNLLNAGQVDEASVQLYGVGQTTPLQVFCLGVYTESPATAAATVIVGKFAKAAMYNP